MSRFCLLSMSSRGFLVGLEFYDSGSAMTVTSLELSSQVPYVHQNPNTSTRQLHAGSLLE